MTYQICRRAIGCKTVLTITKADFECLREMRSSLLAILHIEEAYDILIGNFVELERTVMSLALKFFMRRREQRVDMEEDHRLVNRRLVNLFAAARGFIDQIYHYAKQISGTAEADKNAIRAFITSEANRSVSFRTLQALRNYTQHCGLPSQTFQYGMRWTGHGDDRDKKLVCNVSPSLCISQLHSGRPLNDIFNELAKMKGMEVPLLPLVREYMGSLSGIMNNIRQLYANRQESWFGLIDQWMARCTEMSSDKSRVGIAALVLDDKGKIIDELALSIELKERLAILQKTNQKLVNLDKLQIIN